MDNEQINSLIVLIRENLRIAANELWDNRPGNYSIVQRVNAVDSIKWYAERLKYELKRNV